MTRAGISLAAAVISHILAWAATLYFLFWPIYGFVNVSPGESGAISISGDTLIAVNGLWAALLIVIPVVLTAITLIATLPSAISPLLLLVLRWASFALLLAFCVVSILSIGIFYLPAAIAALVAAVVRRIN